MSASSDIFKAKWLRNVRRLGLASTVSTYSYPHILMSAMTVVESARNAVNKGVGIGDTVLLRILDTDENMLVNVVNFKKRFLESSSVSVYSPLGNALLGKVQGDIFAVSVFRSKIEFMVLHVRS